MTVASNSSDVSMGVVFVCSRCGSRSLQPMEYFDYELHKADYPTEHPDRCRELDTWAEQQGERGWCCHKKTGHKKGHGGEFHSCHRDCGAVAGDERRNVCGLDPDHEGPHGWEKEVKG